MTQKCGCVSGIWWWVPAGVRWTYFLQKGVRDLSNLPLLSVRAHHCWVVHILRCYERDKCESYWTEAGACHRPPLRRRLRSLPGAGWVWLCRDCRSLTSRQRGTPQGPLLPGGGRALRSVWWCSRGPRGENVNKVVRWVAAF